MPGPTGRDPGWRTRYAKDVRSSDDSTGSRLEDSDETQDLDLIVERLAWTPGERLRHLMEMLAFEERARAARNLGPLEPNLDAESEK